MKVILIGGTQGTNKTLIASRLAKKLNISHLISTEQIKEIVKSIISKDQLPSVYENVFNIKHTANEVSNDKIWGYLRQTIDLKPCIEALINSSSMFKDALIIEGIHLIPDLFKIPDDIKLYHFILYQPDEQLHSRLIHQNTKYQIEDYSKIRSFQDYLVGSVKNDSTYLINSSNIESATTDILSKLNRKTLVFDLMGVIFPNKSGGAKYNIRSLYEMLPNKPGTFENFYDRYKLFMIGQISREQFWDKTASNFEEIEKKYLATYVLNNDLVDFIQENSADFRFIALTNHPYEWTKKLTRKFGLKKLFEKIYISGELKMRKPQKAIYKLVMRESNSSSDEIVIIDDQKINLKTAHLLGLKTVYIDNHSESDNFEPDLSVNSLSELKQHLSSII